MINNPFLQQFGPQGDFERPNAPSVSPELASMNAMMRAREAQTRLGIRNMIQGDMQGTYNKAIGSLATQGARYVGTTLSANTAVQLASNSSDLAGAVSGVVGLAGTGYAAYEGNKHASDDLASLNRAIDSGDLTPEQERQARADVFRQGMLSQHVGGLAGYFGGGAIGAVAGASGGAREAWGAYDNNHDRFQAIAHHVVKPWG